MVAVIELIFLFLMVGLFLGLIPIAVIFLVFLETLVFSVKKIQKIYIHSKFVKSCTDTWVPHSLIAKALALTCSSKQTKVPFYLVNAYLHIGQGSIYEINPKTRSVIRMFTYSMDMDRIEIVCRRGMVYNKNEVVHYVPDLEPSMYLYLTYLPEGISY